MLRQTLLPSLRYRTLVRSIACQTNENAIVLTRHMHFLGANRQTPTAFTRQARLRHLHSRFCRTLNALIDGSALIQVVPLNCYESMPILANHNVAERTAMMPKIQP